MPGPFIAIGVWLHRSDDPLPGRFMGAAAVFLFRSPLSRRRKRGFSSV